jgi:hypothetical protein
MLVTACNSIICPSTTKSGKIGDFGHALKNNLAVASRATSGVRLGFRFAADVVAEYLRLGSSVNAGNARRGRLGVY